MKNVSDTLYVRIVLAKSPEDAVIQARECWATPTDDPEGNTRFTLIQDYCASPVVNDGQNPELNIVKNGESTYAEWTSKVFQFAGDGLNERVYLHCYAKVCFDPEGNGSCNKVPCQNRKRRAAYGGMGGIPEDRNVLQKYPNAIFIKNFH